MPRITSPGKFEGEETYVPYFWNQVLDGFHEEVGRGDSSVARIEISDEDRQKFPALGNAKYILLEESDQGFVYSRLSGKKAGPRPRGPGGSRRSIMAEDILGKKKRGLGAWGLGRRRS